MNMTEKNQQKIIRELRAEIERLKSLAYIDELTGSYNRRGFTEEVEKFLREVQIYRESPERRSSVLIKDLSVVLFDIDNFKKVNDTYGHDAGDAVLQYVVKTIQKRVRGIDLVARWGGEEILIALVGANEENAFEIADGIREKIAGEEMETAEGKLRVTVSGGIASCLGAEQFDKVLKRADLALYKAKESGKNRVVRANGS